MAGDPGGLVVARVAPDGEEFRRLAQRLYDALTPLYGGNALGRFPDLGGDPSAAAAVVVREASGRPVGAGAVVVVPGEAGTGELRRMWVEPAWRRRGVGRRLVEALEAVAGELGCHRLRLETGAHQPAAVALYRSLGYRPVRPWPPHDRDPLSVCLARSLPRR